MRHPFFGKANPIRLEDDSSVTCLTIEKGEYLRRYLARDYRKGYNVTKNYHLKYCIHPKDHLQDARFIEYRKEVKFIRND